MFKRLQEKNIMPIYSVTDKEFLSFGRIIEGFNFSAFESYVVKYTEIPASGYHHIQCYIPHEA